MVPCDCIDAIRLIPVEEEIRLADEDGLGTTDTGYHI